MKVFVVRGCRWAYSDGKWFPPCPYRRMEEFVPDVCTHPNAEVPRFGTEYDCMTPRDILCSSGIPDWCPLDDNIVFVHEKYSKSKMFDMVMELENDGCDNNE